MIPCHVLLPRFFKPRNSHLVPQEVHEPSARGYIGHPPTQQTLWISTTWMQAWNLLCRYKIYVLCNSCQFIHLLTRIFWFQGCYMDEKGCYENPLWKVLAKVFHVEIIQMYMFIHFSSFWGMLLPYQQCTHWRVKITKHILIQDMRKTFRYRQWG